MVQSGSGCIHLKENKVSSFVIMESVDGVTQPVAIRKNKEAAKRRCLELAGERKPAGRVESMEDGARLIPIEMMFFSVEVKDTDDSKDSFEIGPRTVTPP